MYKQKDIKALNFFCNLDLAWNQQEWYKKKLNNPMDCLLNKIELAFDREDLWDNGYAIRDNFDHQILIISMEILQKDKNV